KGKRLAQDGPYATFRHPLYAGSFLMALGFSLAGTGGGSPVNDGILWGLFIFLFFFVYRRRILEEEAALEKIFGDAWRAFTAGNHRYIPKFPSPPRSDPDLFLWSRYRKNREYNAFLGWLLGVFVVFVKTLIRG